MILLGVSYRSLCHYLSLDINFLFDVIYKIFLCRHLQLFKNLMLYNNDENMLQTNSRFNNHYVLFTKTWFTTHNDWWQSVS